VFEITDKNFKEFLCENFTDNELMRIINLYSRRLFDQGVDFYGKRDKRCLKKIMSLISNEEFLILYDKMDYGLGKFCEKKRFDIFKD